MYDYRTAIQKILDHTDDNQHELITSAYAIYTICDVVLQTMTKEQAPIPTPSERPTTDDTNTPASPEQTAPAPSAPDSENQPPKKNPEQFPIYSATLIGKLHQIFAANPDLTKKDIIKATNASDPLIYKLIRANDAIYAKTKTTARSSKRGRDKIINHLNGITAAEMLNDDVTISEQQAKHAFDPYRKAHPTQPTEQPSLPKDPAEVLQLKDQYDSFGHLLRDIRQQLHLSQTAFGKQYLDLAMSSVSVLENDLRIPSLEVIEKVAKLTNLSLAELNQRVKKPTPVQPTEASKAEPTQPATEPQAEAVPVKIETVDTPFQVTSHTSNQELIAYCLHKPLNRNTFLAKRNFNQLSLLSNKGDVVYTGTVNSKTQAVQTGDLVTANIVNRHQAYILDVTHRQLNIDPYETIENATLKRWYENWVTYGNGKQTLQELNPKFNFYSVPQGFAAANHLKQTNTINLMWRKNEPEKIMITKVNQPKASKS